MTLEVGEDDLTSREEEGHRTQFPTPHSQTDAEIHPTVLSMTDKGVDYTAAATSS